MKTIFKFNFDCGRQGSLVGTFVSTQEEVDSLIGKRLYFGECLGKHSDIHGDLEKEDITFVTSDQDFVKKFISYFGPSIGYDPFDYLEDT